MVTVAPAVFAAVVVGDNAARGRWRAELEVGKEGDMAGEEKGGLVKDDKRQ